MADCQAMLQSQCESWAKEDYEFWTDAFPSVDDREDIDDPDDYEHYGGNLLDADYIVDSQGNLKGVELLCTFGGPNIWLDTRNYSIEGRWFGCNPVSVPADINMCDEIVGYYDDILYSLIQR